MEKENKADDLWVGQYVLDKHGNPQPAHDLLAWAQWYETSQRTIVLTWFRWGIVSTIFLGLDHSFTGMLMAESPTDPEYKPVLWETMVFGGKLNQGQRRYQSREAALVGHAKLVKECKTAAEGFWDRISLTISPKVGLWIWKKWYKLR